MMHLKSLLVYTAIAYIIHYHEKGKFMKELYVKSCEICQKEFNVIFKKRSVRTCSRDCSYKLRAITKKIIHEYQTKICILCNEEFKDTSKKKMVTTCKECIYKKMVNLRKEKGSYTRTEEQNRKMVETFREKREKGEIKFSEESLKKLSFLLKERWKDGSMKEKSNKTSLEKYGFDHWTKSPEGKEKISKKGKNKKFSIEARKNMAQSAAKRIRLKRHTYSRGNGGFRDDIGIYVRSNWEANFARILKFEQKDYQYEPITFQLEENITYTPDFLCEDTFYEIKGYMNEISKIKLDLFKEKYPEHKICIIQGYEYNLLKEKYKSLIFWE